MLQLDTLRTDIKAARVDASILGEVALLKRSKEEKQAAVEQEIRSNKDVFMDMFDYVPDKDFG